MESNQDFAPFDPLAFKNTTISDAALGALKREISNILSSYVGWYDPFCELIQNALDAVEAREDLEKASSSSSTYIPQIVVTIDLDENQLTVTDNGIGLDKDKFEQFLAPNFSFKSGLTRGHKGVGATYVAYGFNYMRISTKTPGFSRSGRIVRAKSWLSGGSSGANPKIEPDSSPQVDKSFNAIDRGVSITVRFDADTHPKQLSWLKADSAAKWLKILSVKTGIGSIEIDSRKRVVIRVVSKGHTTVEESQGTSYLWLHKSSAKTAQIREIQKTADDLYKKFGSGRKLPDRYSKLDFIYDTWNTDEIEQMVGSVLDAEEKQVLAKYKPTVSVEFGYTAKLWNQFNDGLGLRAGSRVLTSGIQLAANNMPQGETIQIPLNRNIGRQNQVHFLFHYNDYSPDMGRKGFHRELTDFSKNVAKIITENHLSKLRQHLKANTGVSPDLVRELKIGEWKKEMLGHEVKHPLKLENQYFFQPIERVSITSTPTREQDVIALFHQLIAGGVIRGLSIMSTNERFTYDGLFKIMFDLGSSIYIYEPDSNPLGVPRETAEALHGAITDPRILEYKYSLDGLVEDFDSLDKNIKDIDLCISWSTGESYKERYGITSLLLPEDADQRQYHGVTHVLSDLETGSKHCDLIILEELVKYLNDPAQTAAEQRIKYE